VPDRSRGAFRQRARIAHDWHRRLHGHLRPHLPPAQPNIQRRDWTSQLRSNVAATRRHSERLRVLRAGSIWKYFDTAAVVGSKEPLPPGATPAPGLIDAARELLANSLRSLRRAVVDHGADEQLLHGEPHAGNLLRTTSGMRFIDLETCCYGPVEFDIAHAPDEVGDHYALADPLLLRDCRILMLAMVAAWRADRDDDFPNGRAERDALLSQIRAALEPHRLGAIP
jgi:thiamine kinase-like enzyme